MKAINLKNRHILRGKMAEILVNKGKAEFIEEPEVSTVEVIEDEPVVETVEEPEIDSVEMDEETIVETIKQHPTVTEKIISPIEKPLAMAGVNEEFARQVDEFIQQYRPALDELAK